MLLLALSLGIGSAGGSSLDVVTVAVSVVGKGRVTSDTDGIKCGDGKTACYRAFSGDVTLSHSDTAGGWTFDSWSGVCPADPCTLTAPGDYNVTATFGGPSTGTHTLSVAAALTDTDGVGGPDSGGNVTGAGIACGSSGTACSSTVLSGSILTIREAPDPNFVFSGWTGDCGGTDVACTVQMGDDRSVNAAWVQANVTNTLTVNVSGSGKVQGSGIDCPSTCSATEPANGSVTLTATPSDGSTFTGWSGACASSTATTCTFTMTADTAVTATFAPAAQLSVTVNGNGSVSGGSGAINCGNGATICSATFAQNATVTLVATPTTGATFAGWTGACGGTATTCTVLMSAAKSVTASFTGGAAGTGFALTVAVTGNGTVTGGGINCGSGANVCTANQTPNAVVNLTATPSSGATFSGWGGACAGTTPTCTVSMTSAKSVTATFAGGTASFQLTVSVTGAGTVSGGGIDCGSSSSTCSAPEPAGTTVTLTATPAAGASFTGWSGACTGTARSCAVAMNAAKSVTARFTGGSSPGTLTLSVTGRGTVSTSIGACAASGPQKTCTQQFKQGAKATLTAKPKAGASFLGWGGACTGTASTCTLTMNASKSVTARFSGAVGGGGGTTHGTLTSLGAPVVRRSGGGFRVTLRFRTTAGGLAHVRGLRAGRLGASVSLRVAAGRATVGPFPVAKPGLYTFEVRLAGRVLRWKACLGRCGAAATAGPFLLVREAPTVSRSGDVWSVMLHARANMISDARIRVVRGSRVLVNQHFLGRATRLILGPFLLGPGSYTLRLTATDPYGRTRTLTWIVALAR